MKITINSLAKKKGVEKITAITAYDALFGSIFDSNVDVILVGDSLNMSFGGNKDTLNIDIDSMIYHTNAVCKGAEESFIITDMPFGSYQNKTKALKNAVKIYKNTPTDAIKLEGGINKAKIIQSLVQEGICVIGHIGLMPQFGRGEGGYKVKGKSQDEKNKLLDTALTLQESGISMIVLEGIYSDIAKIITENLKIPTIGIGSGIDCDGQILVWSDAFGFFQKFKPKFVRNYLNGAQIISDALKQYVQDIKSGNFPNENESYQ